MDGDKPRRAIAAVAAELYRVLRKTPQPLDDTAAALLHGKKTLSSEDREAASWLAFAALRLRHCIEALESAATTDMPEERGAIHAALALALEIDVPGADAVARRAEFSGADTTSMHERTREVYRALAQRVAERLDAAAPVDEDTLGVYAAYASCPSWILAEWSTRSGGWPAAVALGASLRLPAGVALRVNTRHMTRGELRARLAADGVETIESALSPAGLVLARRARLTGSPLYEEGAFEIQDIGSQLIGYALDPRPGMSVYDACAGAGGKTLHLADLMGDEGFIRAADIERQRLLSLTRRAARCALTSIETVLTRPGSAPRDEHARFDAVLVDAPCSGTGTARRNPAVKWRVSPKQLARLAATQRAILEDAARAVSPGGTLVYATCSLMPDENERVVAAFLEANPAFAPAPLASAFARHGVTSLTDDTAHMLQLTPSEHGTDGFFIARLRRRDDHS